MSEESPLQRAELHLRESEIVPVALPGPPAHTVTVLAFLLVVAPVQVGPETVVVPPGTVVLHCT